MSRGYGFIENHRCKVLQYTHMYTRYMLIEHIIASEKSSYLTFSEVGRFPSRAKYKNSYREFTTVYKLFILPWPHPT